MYSYCYLNNCGEQIGKNVLSLVLSLFWPSVHETNFDLLLVAIKDLLISEPVEETRARRKMSAEGVEFYQRGPERAFRNVCVHHAVLPGESGLHRLVEMADGLNHVPDTILSCTPTRVVIAGILQRQVLAAGVQDSITWVYLRDGCNPSVAYECPELPHYINVRSPRGKYDGRAFAVFHLCLKSCQTTFAACQERHGISAVCHRSERCIFGTACICAHEVFTPWDRLVNQLHYLLYLLA